VAYLIWTGGDTVYIVNRRQGSEGVGRPTSDFDIFWTLLLNLISLTVL
jgi:hypothetical protein